MFNKDTAKRFLSDRFSQYDTKYYIVSTARTYIIIIVYKLE